MPSIPEPNVKTVEGPIRGAIDGEIFVFKGIPYAAPPTGDLRWRPPAPVQHWTKPLLTVDRRAACFQDVEKCVKIGGGNPEPPDTSEDCLYLNVWTPRLEGPGIPLPVMVWIHGGGYVIGAGALPPYVGTPLAKRGAVVVTINYRLGHLGFFAHPALDKEALHERREAVNNFGLLDQIEALKWVQRNIERFGGNKNNVTIFGQSAGGRSVLSLFASPLAKDQGLFHKGVAQSVYGQADVSRPAARVRGKLFAAHFGKDKPDVTAAELRELPAAEFWSSPIPFGPVPISGDSVLPVPMFHVFVKHDEARLPLIIGNNSDDSSVLTEFGFGPEDVIKLLKEMGKYDEVRQLYPDVQDEIEFGRQAGRDMLFTAMSYAIVKNRPRPLQPLQSPASWRYYFDYVAMEARPDFPNGARHGDEVSYIMDTVATAPPPGPVNPGPPQEITEPDERFAEKVSAYWLEFARSAASTSDSIAPGSGLPNWTKHQLLAHHLMWLGKNGQDKFEPDFNFMPARMHFFELFLRDLNGVQPPQLEQIHSYQTISVDEPQKKKQSA